MQINPPPNQPPPTPPAVQPQLVRNLVQPPAAPTITPRAIDSGAQGHKGNAASNSTQKQGATVRTGGARKSGERGSNLDVLV